jgi:hypothetical protein
MLLNPQLRSTYTGRTPESAGVAGVGNGSVEGAWLPGTLPPA